MDQSKLQKRDEKWMSEYIYKNLSMASIYYGSSEELKKCLSVDMFNKPNSLAFFHVMHFIFNLYDPVEFKKRFYWPMIDKKAESSFRTATIEYIKYLNEKHNLKWTNIKTYLVVMPGGTKFISFLFDLLNFVCDEMRKKAAKLVSEEDKKEFSGDPWEQIAKLKSMNENLKTLCSEYLNQMDSVREKIRSVTEQITIQFHKIANILNMTIGELDEDFFREFEKSNDDLFNEIVEKNRRINESLKNPMHNLHQALNTLESFRKPKHYNEKNVQKFLEQQGIYISKELSLDDLLKGFISMKAGIEEELKLLTLNENDAKKLDELEPLANQLQKDWSDCAQRMKKMETLIANSKTPHKKISQQLAEKYVSTPPIKIDWPSCSKDAVVRLPLLGDSTNNHFSKLHTFNETNLQTPSRKYRRDDCSSDSNKTFNSTLQGSKIIDPMRLLRTISKDKLSVSMRDQNLSVLSSKWKNNSTVADLNTSTLMRSPFNPFNSNLERTRIQCTSPFKPGPRFSDASSNSKPNRISAVQKIQEDVSQVKNLNSSPSGRLEALVSQPNNSIPVIFVTNATNTSTEEDVAASLDTTMKIINPDFLDKSSSDIEEDLENISDAILKDVTF